MHDHVGQIKRPGGRNHLSSQECLGMGQVHLEVPATVCSSFVCHHYCFSKCYCPTAPNARKDSARAETVYSQPSCEGQAGWRGVFEKRRVDVTPDVITRGKAAGGPSAMLSVADTAWLWGAPLP
eukprot:2670059-Pleurochrysis_carterae.AAC.2